MNETLSLSLQDLINAPLKAESLLDSLTSDQIQAIEQTLGKVKKRRLNKKPTTTASPLHHLKQQHSAPNEPTTEIKDGVEYVSFVYSHNRTLKRYSIRTDLQQVDISLIDEKFKSENCVYPRANLPKEEYNGNRWAYETECNVLGWQLAWLNKEDIAGKRGLIQRAVDSYRNRYPSMRSRRVARQEKLLNGTLRKRKHRSEDLPSTTSSSLSAAATTHHPKTIAIEDSQNQRLRIKINVESVNLEEINIEFRKANCPFPRVMNIPKPEVNNQRWLEETMCNELAWKLAWLNPRHLAGKKNMLQRALDIYRSKFMPSLQPRKNAKRVAPIPPPTLNTSMMMPPVPLTEDALSAQNALYEQQQQQQQQHSPTMSNSSGTTESLDFADCFSLADEDPTTTTTTESSVVAANAAAAAAFCDLLLQEATLLQDNHSTTTAESTVASPTLDVDLFDQFMRDDPFSLDFSKMYNNSTFNSLLDPTF